MDGLSKDSARVMRNESGESRGFGFVSYQTPDQGEEVSAVRPPFLTKPSDSKCCHACHEWRTARL